MRTLHALAGGLLVLTVGTVATDASAALVGRADLSGAQEVPANASTATGTASFTYNRGTNRLSDIVVDVEGITIAQLVSGPPTGPGPAHIHQAPAGTNGGIIVHLWEEGTFTPNAGGTGFTLTLALSSTVLSDTQETALLAGNTYFNIHTLSFPGGEIRGQIEVTPIPAALPLLASGLGALAWIRRRRAAA